MAHVVPIMHVYIGVCYYQLIYPSTFIHIIGLVNPLLSGILTDITVENYLQYMVAYIHDVISLNPIFVQ